MANDLAKLGLITFSENAAVALARAGGLFERHGVDVDVTRTPSSTEQMRGLIENRWQIASTAFDNVLARSARDGGPRIVGIARASEDVDLPVYVRPEVASWDDLRGKPLAVDAVDTAYGLVLRRVLQEHGLELDRDYAFVAAGATGYRLEAMEKGEAFAAVLNPPWGARAEESGMRLMARHSDVVPGYPGGVFAVSRPWGEAHREEVAAFLRGLRDAMDWAWTPGLLGSAAALAASEMSVGQEQAARALARLPETLRADPAAFAVPLEIRLRFGLAPPNGTRITDYFDASYLDAAEAG